MRVYSEISEPVGCRGTRLPWRVSGNGGDSRRRAECGVSTSAEVEARSVKGEEADRNDAQ